MSGGKKPFNFKDLTSSTLLHEIRAALESKERALFFTGLKGGSKYFLTALISEIEENKKILYISEDEKSVSLHRDNLSAITKSEVPSFISKNLLKGRSLFDKKTSRESKRVDGLVRSFSSKIVCTDISSLFEIITPPGSFKKSFLTITKGQEIDRDKLLERLFQIGYE
ncbi:MAG: hypothetical protein ACRENO_06060, partial [Thermodesulfobacteriota bacterium]